MKILLFLILTIFAFESHGAKILKGKGTLVCDLDFDTASASSCRMVYTKGSDDDSELDAIKSFPLTLTGGQLTALNALVSSGKSDIKSAESIP